jgi:hypothetical protein
MLRALDGMAEEERERAERLQKARPTRAADRNSSALSRSWLTSAPTRFIRHQPNHCQLPERLAPARRCDPHPARNGGSASREADGN